MGLTPGTGVAVAITINYRLIKYQQSARVLVQSCSPSLSVTCATTKSAPWMMWMCITVSLPVVCPVCCMHVSLNSLKKYVTRRRRQMTISLSWSHVPKSVKMIHKFRFMAHGPMASDVSDSEVSQTRSDITTLRRYAMLKSARHHVRIHTVPWCQH